MYKNKLNILKIVIFVNFVYTFILIKYNKVKITEKYFAIFVFDKYTYFDIFVIINYIII